MDHEIELIDKMLAKQIQAGHKKLREAVDSLRVSVKYLLFDLEATRRENVALRRLLEQSS